MSKQAAGDLRVIDKRQGLRVYYNLKKANLIT